MKRDTKQIVDRLASAIAAATIFNPAELKEAAKEIRRPNFWNEPDERTVIDAYAALLENRAARKEEILRKAFG